MSGHLANPQLGPEAIRRANLAHPNDQLLECFLRDSVDPDEAARHLLQAYPADGQDAADWRGFISDWKRLLSTCEFPRTWSDLGTQAHLAVKSPA